MSNQEIDEMKATVAELKKKISPDPKTWREYIVEEIIELLRSAVGLIGALWCISLLTCLNNRMPIQTRQVVSLVSLYLFNQIGFTSFVMLFTINKFVAKIPLILVNNTFIVLVIVLYVWKRLTRLTYDHFIPFTSTRAKYKYNLIAIVLVVIAYLVLILKLKANGSLEVFGDELFEIRACMKNGVRVFRS